MGNSIELEAAGQTFPAYLSRPSGPVKGALIVVHEVWGLVAHIKDVADRYAAEGYLALAPDLFSELGMTEELGSELQEGLFDPDPERRNQVQPVLRELMAPIRLPEFADQTLAKLRACFESLAADPAVQGRIGITGFCFGGTSSFSLAVHEPRLKAVIPFYGHADYTVEQLRDITAPVLAFYGENDASLIQALPALTSAMKEAGVDFTPTVYPGCGHAFFNDTNRFAYNASAAADAWQRTLRFLDVALA